MPRVGVMIAVPSRGTVRIEWAASLTALAMPVNFTRMLKVIPGLSVTEARNVAVAAAVEAEADYLFFLDDDVLVPNQTLTRMIYTLENEPVWDLVTGIVPVKTKDAEPCVFKDDRPGPYWGWTFNERFEIDACGMAACLIRVSSFEKLAEPWFDWEQSTNGHDSAETGEDIYFCRRLKEAGGKLLADGGILCGHMDERGKVWSLPVDCAPIRRAKDGTLEEFVALEAG